MKKDTFILLILLASCFLLTQDTWAKTVVIDASSDTDIRSDDPDSTFSNQTFLLPQAMGANYGSTGTIYYTYYRFDLPDDIDVITAADIKLVQLTGYSITYYLYGVLDDIPQGDSVNGYTWNNAPGHDPTYLTLTLDNTGYFDPDEAQWAGNFYSSAGEIGLGYSAPLIPFLQNDTDGKVTFFMKKRQNYALENTFASLENATQHGPQLSLTYTPKMPAQVVLDPADSISAEEGSSTNYTVKLSMAPTSNVTVNLSYDNTQLTVSPDSLVFSDTDFATPKPVTVTPVDDSIPESDTVYQISHAAYSDDLSYRLCPLAQIAATVVDNDNTQFTINATLDCDVKSISPDSTFLTGDLTPKKDNGDYIYSYLKFQLPSDFQYALDASLKLVLTEHSTAAIDQYIYAVGLNDEAPYGDINTYTWNSAPAIDYQSYANPQAGLNGYIEENATWACSLVVDDDATAGTEIINLSTTNYVLVNFLNTDTDKVITIMLIRNDLGDAVDSFASTENGVYHGPQLELVYGNVPYCGQPNQEYETADINQDCLVDMEDYATLAQQWLNAAP